MINFSTTMAFSKESFTSKQISGHGRGRELGFPTLNLRMVEGIPAEGVYAVHVRFSDQIVTGVMHVGPRPTFDEDDVSIEVHLLDFEGNCPDPNDPITIEILGYLREVMTFDSSEALKKQIAQDIMQATSYFPS
jgi:riboflavin kinase / FMN adenylyltransferase